MKFPSLSRELHSKKNFTRMSGSYKLKESVRRKLSGRSSTNSTVNFEGKSLKYLHRLQLPEYLTEYFTENIYKEEFQDSIRNYLNDNSLLNKSNSRSARSSITSLAFGGRSISASHTSSINHGILNDSTNHSVNATANNSNLQSGRNSPSPYKTHVNGVQGLLQKKGLLNNLSTGGGSKPSSNSNVNQSNYSGSFKGGLPKRSVSSHAHANSLQTVKKEKNNESLTVQINSTGRWIVKIGSKVLKGCHLIMFKLILEF